MVPPVLHDLPLTPYGRGGRHRSAVAAPWAVPARSQLADRSAYEDFDIDRARTQGYGFAHVQRLALEHLLGVR